MKPRLVLVHGSVSNGRSGWTEQRPLAERFELIAPSRGGYPPNPPLERIDFELQADELAELLRSGDHLVGHSYGAVISLLAAARRPEALLGSLTVIEPPAFAVARGDRSVEELAGRLEAFFAAGPYEPADYLRGFLSTVGSYSELPDPLPPELEQGARAAMVERSPAEAELPLDSLAATPFAKLVVSGGHSAAFDAICALLERRLGAERAVLPGAGHTVQRAPGFNKRLAAFVERSA